MQEAELLPSKETGQDYVRWSPAAPQTPASLGIRGTFSSLYVGSALQTDTCLTEEPSTATAGLDTEVLGEALFVRSVRIKSLNTEHYRRKVKGRALAVRGVLHVH